MGAMQVSGLQRDEMLRSVFVVVEDDGDIFGCFGGWLMVVVVLYDGIRIPML